jgi:DNA modification methylase
MSDVRRIEVGSKRTPGASTPYPGEKYRPVATVLQSATCTRCGAWRGELGSEPTVEQYVANMVAVFAAVKRVLRDDGTCWVNIGDTMSSGAAAVLAKNLCLIPERLAIALQNDGWVVRSRIAWCKLAPMPESVRDRPTSAWEHIWLLTKQARYYYDGDAVRQPHIAGNTQRQLSSPKKQTDDPRVRWRPPYQIGEQRYLHPMGANLRNWWPIGPEPFPEAHFATFPSAIPRRAIQAGTSAVGGCAACGAPWRRVVERGNSEHHCRPGCHHDPAQQAWNSQGWTGYGSFQNTAQVTGSWQPTCPCADPRPPVPQLVLDPFTGSGTTLAVARELGRQGIGIDLQPAYLDIAVRRLEAPPKAKRARAPKPPPAPVAASPAQPSLWEASG